MSNKQLSTIGRVERITIPAAGLLSVPAKIDTGAYRSSIWATNVHERGGRLYFTLLGEESPFYSGKELSTDTFRKVTVENSFGQKEERYSVFLGIEVCGRKVKANFTLANREMKTYPALIGRKLLHNRFLVDVTKGSPLADEQDDNDIESLA